MVYCLDNAGPQVVEFLRFGQRMGEGHWGLRIHDKSGGGWGRGKIVGAKEGFPRRIWKRLHRCILYMDLD